MKKVLTAALMLVLLGAILIAQGRGNVVRHVKRDGSIKEMLSSQGSCRHHLSAHPEDLVATPGGWINDPSACN